MKQQYIKFYNPIIALLLAALIAMAYSWFHLPLSEASIEEARVNVYENGHLGPGWQDWSWAKHQMQSKDYPFQGQPVLEMNLSNWSGTYFHHNTFSLSGYDTLTFEVNGGITGGQTVAVCLADSNQKFMQKVDVGKYMLSNRIPQNHWTMAIIPLSKLLGPNKNISGIVFQENAGKIEVPVYITNITFHGKPIQQSDACDITIDDSLDVHPISPLIYGMASASSEYIKDLKLGINRWGGNPSSRYNWEKGNCWNAARDWEFRNGNYGCTSAADRQPSGVADAFIQKNIDSGAETLLTIPTLGWVAKDDNNNSRSINVPSKSGPPVSPGSDAIAGYDPKHNQERTSIRSYPRKGRPFQFPPELTDNAVYQDEWVAHLVNKFGNASHGGVRFYAMDNEPDLWDSTHTDVHPVRVSYDDLLSNFLAYASAIKDVDPSCSITGPVSWGWTGYYYSASDRDNWAACPDRRAHGNMPLLPWFLQQVAEHDKKTGRRTLDVLDIHFYPQANGVYQGKDDAETNALRLRSTRALWDPSYIDESWIGQPVMLIPRMKTWIKQYYPGTKLGITEWNWGADKTMNGGLAVAECLGVFGKEGLYIANYWTSPPVNSPGYFAFKLYRNADNKGNGFGDSSIEGLSSMPSSVSCFASLDKHTGYPAVILLNKLADRTMTAHVHINSKKTLHGAILWRYSSLSQSIVRSGAFQVKNRSLTITIPAYSMNLLRFY
jgi:hypothetical protein